MIVKSPRTNLEKQGNIRLAVKLETPHAEQVAVRYSAQSPPLQAEK